MRNQSIESLEKDYWKEQTQFPSSLVEKCFKYRKIPISELTVEQIRLLISQNIGLKYLVNLSIEKLEQNPLAEGDFYEGDLLNAVSNIPTTFWKDYKEEIKSLKKLVENNSELIQNEMGKKNYAQIIEKIKKAYA